MACPACRYLNEHQARFCAQCGQPLEASCPACGSLVKAEMRFCNQCGQSLAPRLDAAGPSVVVDASPTRQPSLDEKLGQLQGYFPRHLAAKILANSGRLEGERKLVSVLFADVAGYTALSEQLGEEALFALMDDLYEVFIHEVHRYEGMVNELTGDGIVAFFGAPLAVEQAPQRAVRAALALQDAVAQFSRRLEHERGVSLQIRVGINAGPVIVGTVGNDLRMDYKAIGNTVNLAARMEQTAAPGTVQITEQAYKLVAGYFECQDLGLMQLKGTTTKARAYRVLGERSGRARIDVARERGFTRLVGRERELALLQQGLTMAREGRGQAVSIIGDAGLGKSRLVHEFRQSLGQDEVLWLDGRCSPYGSTQAYLPILEVLRQHLRLDANAQGDDLRRQIAAGVTALGPGLEMAIPYILHVLEVEADTSLPSNLAPEALKQRTFEALRLLLCDSAGPRPLVLAIEDLHWSDHTSVEWLTSLLEHMAGARILLVCTYRPDFTSMWSRRSYHHVISLTHLTAHESAEMLTALLGTAHIQDDLATLVLHKTEGVPFFLEELVKALQETEAITLHAGQWQFKPGNLSVGVPDTVEEVLLARIDRLPDGAKSVLQLGAVIGREWNWTLLKEVAGLPEWELSAALAALTDAELLYARGLPPQATYLFKHAFTQEASYRSLLTTRRRDLHHRVAVTIEALFPDRLEEHYGQLVQHFFEAAQPADLDKAIEYATRAGARNLALPAYADAARFYQLALQALERQTPVDETHTFTLLRALGEAQWKAGEHVQACATLQRAANSARRLGSATDFARAALEFESASWLGTLPAAPAVDLLAEALQGLDAHPGVLRARVLGSLARALMFTGELEQAERYAQRAVSSARHEGDPGLLAASLQVLCLLPWAPDKIPLRLTYLTEMLHCAQEANEEELALNAYHWLMLSHLELGDMQASDAAMQAMAQLADKLQISTYLYMSRVCRVMRVLLGGDLPEAERLLLSTYTLSQRVEGEAHEGIFGLLMFTLRREQGRLHEIEPALRYFMQQQGGHAAWKPGLALLYSELGRTREARDEFERLAQHDFTDIPRDALWMSCMTYLADVCVVLGDAARAVPLYRLLLPYTGHNAVIGNAMACYGAVDRYLGALATTLECWHEAEQHFQAALAMNTRMGARPWLAHTQYQYARMLLARHQSDDPAQAAPLLEAALATAQELGMRALAERITQQVSPHLPPAPLFLGVTAALSALSQREVDVLRLVALGKSNRDIAETLYISLNTVATHVRSILTKTGCANRTAAAAYAMHHGL